MVRVVFFDIDGTLIRTGGAGIEAFARAFEAEFNVRNGTQHMRFAGRTDVSLVREMFTAHKIENSPENFRRFFENYLFWLDELLPSSGGEICPGVQEFLQDLERLSQPPLIGLLTGNIRLGAEIKLRHFKLWDAFRTGGFGDDHEDRCQIAVVARDRGRQLLNGTLTGDEIVVVGDTPHDARCGKAIGARILAVATGGASSEELRECKPDWVVTDLRHVSAKQICGR